MTLLLGLASAAGTGWSQGGPQAGPAQPSPVLGAIGSTSPVIIDGIAMSPTASSSWPLVAKDEVVTQAPALLTTEDHSLVTFEGGSKARLDLIGGAQPTAAQQTYILVREGGLTFDSRAGTLAICIGGRFFIPRASAKGTLRLGKNGAVSQHLDSGTFSEQGVRGCSEAGPGSFLTGAAGAAGAVAGAGPTAAGVTVGSTAGAVAAAAGTAVGLGTAAATGAFSSANTCATAGCNTNPAVLSPVQP